MDPLLRYVQRRKEIDPFNFANLLADQLPRFVQHLERVDLSISARHLSVDDLINAGAEGLLELRGVHVPELPATLQLAYFQKLKVLGIVDRYGTFRLSDLGLLKHLITLDITYHGPPPPLAPLLVARPNLTTLVLRAPSLDAGHFATLAALPSLCDLSLDVPHGVTDDALATLPGLTKLNLCFPSAAVTGSFLKSMPRLANLELHRPYGFALEHLKLAPQLRNLALLNMPKLTTAPAELLFPELVGLALDQDDVLAMSLVQAHAPTLKSLRLMHVGDMHALTLALASAPAFTRLGLGALPNARDSLAVLAARLPSLDKLALCGPYETTLAPLAKMTALKYLYIWRVNSEADAAVLCKLTQLTSLRVSHVPNLGTAHTLRALPVLIYPSPLRDLLFNI